MTFADWLKIRTEPDGDCLIWQQGLNSGGYPQGCWQGKPVLVARLVVEHRGGRKMRSNECAVPACGNKLCVSELCLRLRSRSAVLKKAYATGARCTRRELQARQNQAVRQGWAKLDWQKVDEIRSKHPEKNITELAKEYGVSHKAVSEVVRNLSWVKIETPASVFQWRP